jgi:putative transposase
VRTRSGRLDACRRAENFCRSQPLLFRDPPTPPIAPRLSPRQAAIPNLAPSRKHPCKSETTEWPVARGSFVWLDRKLDEGSAGPKYLLRPEIAKVVRASILKGVELNQYDLCSWVIMPNHVHVLIQPKIPPSRLLQSLKGATARECNRLLGRRGEPFWQGELYDHWVRNEDELARISRYIDSNPVKAGLTAKPEDWSYSSATRIEMPGTGPHPGSLDAAGTGARATTTTY